MSQARRHWTQRFFGPLYGYLYQRHLLPAEQTRREVQFASTLCGLRRKCVLDLAAGFGRHARLLARSNQVWALDQNRAYLAMAREKLSPRTLKNLRTIQADMRALPFREEVFDAVLLLFNSFGYFTSAPPPERELRQRELWRLPAVFYERGLVPEDFGVWREAGGGTSFHQGRADGAMGGTSSVQKGKSEVVSTSTTQDENFLILEEVARVLRPEGDFLLEVPNPRPLLAAVAEAPRRWLVTNDFEIEEEYTYDRTRALLSNVTRFSVPGRTEWADYHIRLYSRRELEEALRGAGFKICGVYGSYAGERYGASRSPMILLHAQRKR